MIENVVVVAAAAVSSADCNWSVSGQFHFGDYFQLVKHATLSK